MKNIFDYFKKRKAKKQKTLKEKEYQTKMLIAKTKKDMEENIIRLKNQKVKFLNIAKEARSVNDKTGLQQAYTGWKISDTSQKRANKMLIKLNITEQMKDIAQISKNFSQSMLQIAKELNGITEQKKWSETQNNYEKAMEIIANSEESIEQFFETIDDSFEETLPTEDTEETSEKDFLTMVDESIADKEREDLEKKQNRIAQKNINENKDNL